MQQTARRFSHRTALLSLFSVAGAAGWARAQSSPVVERGLAKDPAQRFQSTREMLADLYQVLGGHFAVQCPVTFMKKVGGTGVRFADRHPLLAMIGTATLVGLVAFALFEIARMIV